MDLPYTNPEAAARVLAKPLTTGNIEFDPVGRTAYIDKRPQALFSFDLALLETLMRRAGRVVPKKLVEDQLFGLSDEVRSNAVEVHVHRLRKQLAKIGACRDSHHARHRVPALGDGRLVLSTDPQRIGLTLPMRRQASIA